MSVVVPPSSDTIGRDKANKGLQQQHYLFRTGFGQYLETGQFSDVILIHDGKQYCAHQLIVVHSSDYFASVLNERAKLTSVAKTQDDSVDDNIADEEAAIQKKIVLTLTFPDPDHVFGTVLKYMYEGNIVIDDDNCISLLNMANYLQIEDLKTRLYEYLIRNITRGNVIQILKRAVDYNTDEIIEKCILVLARNFSQLHMEGVSFHFLPLRYMLDLLQHPSLQVTNEYSVFQTICSYLKGSQFSEAGKITENVLQSLFECVRFPYLKFEELEEAVNCSLVPQHLLAEALMIRLATHECPEKAKTNVLRLQRRAACGRVFEYSYDFDDRGVLHWLGTKGGTAKWRNPCIVENGISITASCVEKGDPITVASRNPVENWTMDVPASWYQVDLGATRSLIVSHVTLRHGGNSKQDCLRHWVIQCSDDATNWIVLSRHRDEKILDSNFSTFTWQINTCTKPYRYFRVLQTGHNSSNHNFLSLSGIELYGELYDTKWSN